MNCLKVRPVLSIPPTTLPGVPFPFAFFATTGLLAVANTGVGNKPFPAYSAGTFFNVTVICHDALLKKTQENNGRGKRKEEKNRWVTKPGR
ncbi:MAG: hypothetical protein GQ542_09010 [Desulforhopalus sp.]|jgi:hypothetical protein|nr:hypothetical protein [Desulforhopalus sp.]